MRTKPTSRVHGLWCYLYRAIDRDGNLIDTMLSATRNMKAARRFFRSARSVVGFVPDRMTTDGHNSYPRAIRLTLGRNVRHRTSVYLNNRLVQDHRGIKGRIRCMRGFKELRDFLRCRARHNQYVPATRRRRHFLQHARIAMGIMQIANQKTQVAQRCVANGARRDRTTAGDPASAAGCVPHNFRQLNT
jgi:putative transposase